MKGVIETTDPRTFAYTYVVKGAKERGELPVMVGAYATEAEALAVLHALHFHFDFAVGEVLRSVARLVPRDTITQEA